MAGEAQNKLGELFVDLGVGGVGKTLKALNSVSATFLLTKNTAQQMVKPLVDIGKQSLNSAVEIGKLSASFGTSLVEAQKFAYYLKEKNLSEGLLGDLQSMQNKFTQIKMGFAGVDGQMAMSMNMLGLDWQNYDGSAQSMLQYVKDIQNAVKGMNANEARMHLQNLGLGNTDWLYAFQRGDFNLGNALGNDNKVLEDLQDASEEANKLNNNLDKLKKKISGKAAKWVNENLLTPANTFFDVKNQESKATESQKNELRKLPGVKTAEKTAKLFADEKNNKTKNKKGSTTGQGAPIKFGDIELLNDNKLKPLDNKQNINPIETDKNLNKYPLNLDTTPLSNLTSQPNQNIEINNQFNITGDNAQEIADKVASIDKEQLQYNQYQAHNMAGI